MENMTEEVKSYKCKWCGELHNFKTNADLCAFNHAKYNYANSLLEKGYGLKYINSECNFRWDLTKEQENITKDECFIVSHWQCCEKPAYTIREISENGCLRLGGVGGWGGYYGNWIEIDRLPKANPKEKLYVYTK